MIIQEKNWYHPPLKPIPPCLDAALPVERLPHVGEEFRRDNHNRIFRVRVVVRPWPELTAWAKIDGPLWGGPGPLNVKPLRDPDAGSGWVQCDLMLYRKEFYSRKRLQSLAVERVVDHDAVRPVPSCKCLRWSVPGESARFVSHGCTEGNRGFDLLAARELIMGSIPNRVVGTGLFHTNVFFGLPIELIRACVTHRREVVDLFRHNPALLFAFGCRRDWLPANAPGRWDACAEWLELKQRDLCGRLGFPATQQMANLFRRFKPSLLGSWGLKYLHEVAQRPELLDVLSNAPECVERAGNLQFWIADLASLGGLLHPFFIRRLMERKDAEELKRVRSAVAEIQSYLKFLGRTQFEAQVRGRGELQKLHNACATEFDAVREERWSEESERAWDQARGEGVYPPPLRGTAHIRPLKTAAEIRAEGAVMGHCVGNYVSDVASGKVHIYSVLKPERATASVVRGDGRWVIGAIRGPGNAAPLAETIRAVTEWIGTAKARPGSGQPGLAPHVRLITDPEAIRPLFRVADYRNHQWRQPQPTFSSCSWDAPLNSTLASRLESSHSVGSEWSPLAGEATQAERREAREWRLLELGVKPW